MACTLTSTSRRKNRKLFIPKGGKSPRLTFAISDRTMRELLRRAEEEQKPAAFIARRLIDAAIKGAAQR